jgi:hypothetical protein
VVSVVSEPVMARSASSGWKKAREIEAPGFGISRVLGLDRGIGDGLKLGQDRGPS